MRACGFREDMARSPVAGESAEARCGRGRRDDDTIRRDQGKLRTTALASLAQCTSSAVASSASTTTKSSGRRCPKQRSSDIVYPHVMRELQSRMQDGQGRTAGRSQVVYVGAIRYILRIGITTISVDTV
jgi:hypothetical protein